MKWTRSGPITRAAQRPGGQKCSKRLRRRSARFNPQKWSRADLRCGKLKLHPERTTQSRQRKLADHSPPTYNTNRVHKSRQRKLADHSIPTYNTNRVHKSRQRKLADCSFPTFLPASEGKD